MSGASFSAATDGTGLLTGEGGAQSSVNNLSGSQEIPPINFISDAEKIHEPAELLQKPEPAANAIKHGNKPNKEVPCRYFAAGFCTRSEDCWFKHDLTNYTIESATRIFTEKPKKTIGNITIAKKDMVPGGAEKALQNWRRECHKAHIAQALKLQKEREEAERLAKLPLRTKKARAQMLKDVERILATKDNVGDPIRNLEKMVKSRNVVVIKKPKEPKITIPEHPLECHICGDIPTVYSILERCNHLFCFECISAWRAASQDNRPCPVCRVRSDHVIKTSIFAYSPGLKHVVSEPAKEGPAIQRDLIDQDGPSSQGLEDAIGKLSIEDKVQSEITKENHEDGGDDEEASANTDDGNDERSANTTRHKKQRVKKQRPRRGHRVPESIPQDPNPAKTRLLYNYRQKLKTIPCKNFMDATAARTVETDNPNQSAVWADRSRPLEYVTDWDLGGRKAIYSRRIPRCEFGNFCFYSHPHPRKPLEEYVYDVWESKKLEIKCETQAPKRATGNKAGGINTSAVAQSASAVAQSDDGSRRLTSRTRNRAGMRIADW